MKEYNIIGIDGPAGTGKGTLARRLSEYLGYYYLDTGLYYRAIAYLMLNYHIDIGNEEEIKRLASDLNLKVEGYSITINDEELGNELRSMEVNKLVSKVAALTDVRLIINDKIRRYAYNKNIVLDGRDVTTVIFPDAKYKIFITASVEERARRRYEQMLETREDVSLEDVIKSISERDEADRIRKFGALTIADDAFVLDTSDKDVDSSLNELIKYVKGE